MNFEGGCGASVVINDTTHSHFKYYTVLLPLCTVGHVVFLYMWNFHGGFCKYLWMHTSLISCQSPLIIEAVGQSAGVRGGLWHKGHLCVCVCVCVWEREIERGHVLVPACVGVYSYRGTVSNHRGQRAKVSAHSWSVPRADLTKSGLSACCAASYLLLSLGTKTWCISASWHTKTLCIFVVQFVILLVSRTCKFLAHMDL